MNYLNRASRCCLRQNLHTFTCFCIVRVELLGGDCDEKPRLGTGRVASLAHLETIRKEVEAGWTMQAVYDTHGPKLGFTYSAHRRQHHWMFTTVGALLATHQPFFTTKQRTQCMPLYRVLSVLIIASFLVTKPGRISPRKPPTVRASSPELCVDSMSGIEHLQ